MTHKRTFLAAISFAVIVSLMAAGTSLARNNRNNRNRRRGGQKTKHYSVSAKVTSVKKIGTATGTGDLASRHAQAFSGRSGGSAGSLQGVDVMGLRKAAAASKAAKTNETDSLFIKR